MLKKRVLIVDDAPDFGRMLQATLSMIGGGRIHTALVPSAEEAMLEISRLAPDLVVSDLRLPGISGLDLIRKIRARAGQVKIVMVTGMKDPGLADQAVRAGADLFFVKPLTMVDFIAAVQQLLYPNAPAPVPAPQAPGARATIPAGVQDLLDEARANLGALSVLLLDVDGNRLLWAGETVSLASGAISAALQSMNAATALADALEPPGQETVLAVKGSRVDWVLCPAGEHVLVMALPAGRGALRLPLAFEAALALQVELRAALPLPGVDPVPAVQPVSELAREMLHLPQAEAVEETAESSLSDLETLFDMPAGERSQDDAAAFWEQAVAGGHVEPVGDDALTYDQAARMGLTPGSGV